MLVFEDIHHGCCTGRGRIPRDRPRRAFSVTYMEADTRTLDTGIAFPVVFGPGTVDPATVGDKREELVRKFYDVSRARRILRRMVSPSAFQR